MMTTSLNGFAKILATENIGIFVDSTVSTAMIDIKDRVMILPDWSKLSDDQQILLRAHEVGHARFTPWEGWHSNIGEDKKSDTKEVKRERRRLKQAINIVEDARIERLMKEQFPGLRQNFVRGYKEFFDGGLFGDNLDAKAVNEMNILDRFNMYYKIGAHVPVQFDAAEKLLIAEAEAMKTFEDAVVLAKKLLQKAKDDAQTAANGVGGSQKSKKGKGDPMDGEGEDDEDGDGVEATTDTNQRSKESDLANKTPTNLVTNLRYTQASSDSLKECICNITEDAIPGMEAFIRNNSGLAGEMAGFFGRAKRSSGVINMFFEMMKAAKNSERARINKSGSLNLSKLHKYTYSEDIFLSQMTFQKGKNHGLVFFVDFSGSMRGNMGPTMQQLIALMNFCVSQNIPHEIYAMYPTSSNRKEPKGAGKNVMVYSPNFRLLKMFSSQYSKRLTKVLREFWAYWGTYSFSQDVVNRCIKGANYSDCSTPLAHTLFAAVDILREFRKNYKCEVVHPIFLTDGGGNDQIFCGSQQHVNRYSNIHYVDDVNGVTISESIQNGNNHSVSMLPLKVMRKLGYNATNFYVIDQFDHVNYYANYFLGNDRLLDGKDYQSKHADFTKRGSVAIQDERLQMGGLYLLTNAETHDVKAKEGKYDQYLQNTLRKIEGADKIVLKQFVSQICGNY